MVLTEKEKDGALKILRLLSEAEVMSLAKTVTKNQIIIGTREGKSERAASCQLLIQGSQHIVYCQYFTFTANF